jgi:hypothetical protein
MIRRDPTFSKDHFINTKEKEHRKSITGSGFWQMLGHVCSHITHHAIPFFAARAELQEKPMVDVSEVWDKEQKCGM